MKTLSFGLAAAFVAVAALGAAGPARAQSGEGWTVLLDADNMGDWEKVGETNWRMEDGALVADKRTSEAPAFLVSKEKYKDFELYVEFWASDDANSGVFLRCFEPPKITDRLCYEANIFDQREDPSYGTGGVVRFSEVDPMPKAGGKWNTYEITADGRDITVVLNSETTAKLRNGMFEEGPIALQHGSGTVKFRKVAIRPL
jgi:hypothetical protein